MLNETIDAASASSLLDYKRAVFELYSDIRHEDDPRAGWAHWKRVRDELFKSHAQSPIPPFQRKTFPGLAYFDYDPAARVVGDVVDAEPHEYEIATSGNGSYGFTRFAFVSFEIAGRSTQLELYWLHGYGGGLFLPFRDATSGTRTYGAGRYLLDTIKGADLGMETDKLVLDFNFAYNPSCAYDPKWVCPLAPPPNRLDIPIEAGEKTPPPYGDGGVTNLS